jgi:hypothetical protein
MISATTRSDCARVAAVKARVAARSRKLDLLCISGMLGDARAQVDVHVIADAVTRVFEEHDVSDEARDAVLAALRPQGCRARG